MQVSDLLVQYQNNLSSGSEVSTKTKGIEQLVETVKQLKTGNIFEGTVNSVRGSQVILGLSSGQNITAHLDAGLSLVKGQSVFFQVKSNDGEQIRIKPISMGGNQGNPTLIQGLAVGEKNLNMVNAMMKEQMSIDAKSLQNMARQMGQIPGSSPETIVQMQKLQLPIDVSSVEQFEHYKANQREVLGQVQQLIAVLGDAFSQEDMSGAAATQLHNELVGFFGDASMQEAIAEKQGLYVQEMQMPQGQEEPLDLQSLAQKASVFSQTLEDADTYATGTLGAVLDEKDYVDLQKQLSQFPSFIREHANFFTAEGQLRPQTQMDAFLQEISVFLGKNGEDLPKEMVQKLLGSKGYQKLFLEFAEKQFTMEPEDLPKERSVSQLYERMAQQIQGLQQLADKVPVAKDVIQTMTSNLSQNIEFMNQLNQMYSYVQVPMRLRGQNVSSELFVYRNAKGTKSEQEELTAFLHFQMESLGNVDISVKMKQKNVSANWYLEKMDSLIILEENMHLLTERLQKKGYYCDMKLEQDKRDINFVEDFLKADQKTGKEVHRYSFDVRA